MSPGQLCHEHIAWPSLLPNPAFMSTPATSRTDTSTPCLPVAHCNPSQGLLSESALTLRCTSALRSHLQGMFFRTARMLEAGIKPVYVFDGVPPAAKKEELARR